jgi:serine/threonine protein phosphatase PrpC
VGDSRLYLLREGRVWIRTRDHTRVADLLESGLITEQRARIHPLRNQVSRCLGGGSRLPQVSSGPCVYLQEGDVVLLCTDGLWSALPDARLFALLDACDLATELDILSTEAECVCYPRSDNITAVAIRWEGERSDDARSRQSKRPQLMPPSADDPVARAIAEIEQALEEYQGEMKEDCCSR